MVRSSLSMGVQTMKIVLTSCAAAECIYKKRWTPRPSSSSRPTQTNGLPEGQSFKALSAEDDAKLVFGVVFSLRNFVRKLGGPDDKSVNPSTSSKVESGA